MPGISAGRIRVCRCRSLAAAAMLCWMALAANTWAAEELDTAGELRSFGTMGKQVHILRTDAETELFSHRGKGCLTHMWFGGNFRDYGKTRIRVYVDGEKTASIDMELMMGHGIGFQDAAAPWGTAQAGKTGHPSGIYNTYRIPFGKSVRVTAQLPEAETGNPPFWYVIRGVENLPVEMGGVRLPDGARLKLHRRESYTADRLKEFAICEASGAGVLYQTTVAAESTNLNYLEACVRAYIDGAEEPMFLSSGLEDYFLGTYYFNRGTYHNAAAGLTHMDRQNNSFSAYRFHNRDPIFFHDGFRLTLRCGEKLDGQVFGNPRPTTYTTYVWTYEW